METKSKILIIMADRKKADEIAICLTQSGFEITDVVPYLFNALQSVERITPDVVILETDIREEEATFIATCLKIPLVLISNQQRQELQSFYSCIKLHELVHKPFSLFEVVAGTISASYRV